MKNRKNGGITLIALVITIIVLLILAGITINLTIGEDGIIKRVEEAGKNYTEAAEKEKTELEQFSNLTDRIIDNVTKNHYTMVNGVPVPKGFSYKEGTKDTGFVIINDTDRNEFVWVPCTIDGANGSIKYDRYAFLDGQPANGIDNVTNSIKIKQSTSQDLVYTETMSNDEKQSVKTYGGFYIGRYESGVEGYDAEVSKSNNSSSIEWTGYSNGKLVIKSNQQVWNWITKQKAKNVSETLYKKENGDSVNSKLCSGYAWDTALKFIEIKEPTYLTNSVGGYYEQSEATKTGYDITHPCNIYDMGGNTWEWTTEASSDGGYPCSNRGGAYNNSASAFSAAYRGCRNKTYAKDDVSFRVTLYL